MNFPLFIARRYLFGGKSHNVINVISAISMAGIALASFALICTLSVFNGFHSLVSSLFSDFDPTLRVVPAGSRFFQVQDFPAGEIRSIEGVEECCFSLEEQALIRYGGRQEICMIKGIEDSFHQITGIENLLRGNGIFMLMDDVSDYAILGIGLSGRLDCGINPVRPFSLYVPRRHGSVNPLNPSSSFNRSDVFSPGVVFMVNQEKYDDNYALVSLDMARRLTDRDGQASAFEISVAQGYSVRKVKNAIRQAVGPDYLVQDRIEQQADVFKVVSIEKLISYVFLTFILLIACFNLIGSLIMLVIDKKQDASLLESIGAERRTVEQVFIANGLLISAIGAVSGLLLGIAAVFVQQRFGIIRLGGEGSFIVSAYPVELKLQDVALVLATVLAVSWISVRPIGRISRKFLDKTAVRE